ncbi:endolysin [Enterococcus florum]|uniref:Endolysin n=1 Tax=Enterococcus florum TaxID=2480627 RepID=A0A4P5P4F6_9ENTE|nr:phage tail tip lysozyme [Enterococcus florum]GCF92510.1 endolysin [Enterococcus florum]
MGNINTAIQWFIQRQGKVYYYMGGRGPNAYDCSSSVYFAMVAAGYFPPGKMGYTDTLFNDLEAIGWKKTSSPVKGDIFIWGVRGSSGGAAGHTGMFINEKDIIHCNAGSNGISVDNYANSHSYSNPPHTIYHDPSNNGGTTVPRRTFTEVEQNVITMFKILRPLGYSLQAIAAKAGNADAESGLKPNTAELGGGPGFGIFQWTSPNYGESGIAYVTRLLRNAGIEGDPRSMEAQVKLGHWGMTNGQWIGVVEPRTFDGFKAGTDVNQLTLAFLRNFERAGVERLQSRQASAQKWYQFLVEYEQDPEGVELPGNEEKKELINAGELEEFGIKEGKLFAKGWHFSSNKPQQTIEVIDATNDKVLKTFDIELKERQDIKEKYQDIEGVEQCGFEIEYKPEKDQSVYLKGIRSDGANKDELIFDGLIMYEPAEDAEIDEYAQTNEKFWFEILENGIVKARGTKILNNLSWENELMYVPETEIELPIYYKKYFIGREEVKLYINNKVFQGIALDVEEDTGSGIIVVPLIHVIDEWNNRQLSTNLACKNRTIMDIFSTYDFRYSKKWHVDFLQDAAKRSIDYVYSRQTKLDALTKTCNLTDDVYWRVGFFFGRLLEIGTFGEKKFYTISTKPSSRQNIRIIEEPTITTENSNVVNAATVYGEKSDSGMSSMSLREVFLEAKSQIKGFPVRILRNAINNERGYDYVNYTKLAPNNAIEYTVVDEESVKRESNTLIESTFSFNDLAPFSVNGETISDEDRAKAARTAYEAAVKRLKQSRYRIYFEMTVERLPQDLNVGDRVRFLYDYQSLIDESCSEYIQDMLKKDDWFYLTKIGYDFGRDQAETNVIRLEKEIRMDRGD